MMKQTLSISVIALLAVETANAQDATQSANATNGLEEIVVTAQKRA